jgi:hypothetical protein
LEVLSDWKANLTLDEDLFMKTSRFLTGTLAAGLLIGTPVGVAMAQSPQPAPAPQVEVSDTQIDQFVSAYRSILAIQEEAQADLVTAVEATGLTVDDYNAIAEVQQAPDATAQIPAEQSQQFATAVEQVRAIRTEVRADMAAAIQAESLTIEEFEQILALARQDPNLRAAIGQRLAQ